MFNILSLFFLTLTLNSGLFAGDHRTESKREERKKALEEEIESLTPWGWYYEQHPHEARSNHVIGEHFSEASGNSRKKIGRRTAEQLSALAELRRKREQKIGHQSFGDQALKPTKSINKSNHAAKRLRYTGETVADEQDSSATACGPDFEEHEHVSEQPQCSNETEFIASEIPCASFDSDGALVQRSSDNVMPVPRRLPPKKAFLLRWKMARESSEKASGH